MNRDQLSLAVATVALVPAVFGASLPPLAEVHRMPDDGANAAAHRQAVLMASAAVLGVSVVADSPTVAVAGFSATAALAYLYAKARQA